MALELMTQETMDQMQGDGSGNPDEAQAALDDALHDVNEMSESARDYARMVDELMAHHVAMESMQLGLRDSLKSGGAQPELYSQAETLLQVVRHDLGEETSEMPALESFSEATWEAQTEVALEAVAETIAKLDRWMMVGMNRLTMNISQFFAGTQRVSIRALDVLAHAERMLDHPGEAKVKQISLSGALAKSLQTGRETVSLTQAVHEVLQVGKETTERWVPELLAYANGMANAFGQSDLSKMRDVLGITKRGFMERSLAFAEVKAPMPSFCTVPGDKRFFFSMFRDAYRQTTSSKPLPGNRIVEVTHPVGNLKTYVERDDVKGYFETFPKWLTVSVAITKASGAGGSSTVATVLSPAELKESIHGLRDLLRELRTLSVKSASVQQAMESIFDAYESHIYKRWDSLSDKAVNVAVGWFPHANLIQNFYGYIATGSGQSLYQAVLGMGKYLSNECHGLASVALKMAKTYPSA